jgi:hypothetical protein
VTVRFKRHQGAYAEVSYWPEGRYSLESDRTFYGPRVLLDFDPFFKRHKRLMVRILLHEIGHVLQALERPHGNKQLHHGRSFRRHMRRIVASGAFDENEW